MKTKTEKHTPTPWRADNDFAHDYQCRLRIFLESSDGKYIGEVTGEQTGNEIEGNAAFIVRAVNSHEALIDKAERLLEYLDEWGLDIPEEQAKAQRIIVKEMRDAIERGK